MAPRRLSNDALIQSFGTIKESLDKTHAKLDKIETELRSGYATKESVEELRKELDTKVSRDRYIWVERGFLGGVAAVLMAVLWALLGTIGLRHP